MRQLPGRFLDPATFNTSENAVSLSSSIAAPSGFNSLLALFQARVSAKLRGQVEHALQR